MSGPQPEKKESVGAKNWVLNFRDWELGIQKINNELSNIIKPAETFRPQVEYAVAPLSSAGRQLEYIKTNFDALKTLPTSPDTVRFWDFFTGSATGLASTISPSMLQPEARPYLMKLIAEGLPEVQKKSKEIAAELEKEITEDGAAENLERFQESLMDAQIVSSSIYETALEYTKSRKGLWERLEGWVRSVSDALIRIKTRIGLSATAVVGDLVDQSMKLVDKLKEGARKVGKEFVEAFSELGRKLAELFSKIISGMFAFVRRIQSLAREKRFTMTEITIEIEGSGIEIITFAGFPIPIPRIKSPKLSMKFTPPT